MKVTFLSEELSQLEILCPTYEFEALPEIGDSVGLNTYLKSLDKARFNKLLQKEGKINNGVITGRAWHREEEENLVYISIEFNQKD